MAEITEHVLAQIWNAQWLVDELRATDGRPLRVVYRGVWTHGVGPDFAGALIDIDGTLVSGDVEVHLNASGWHDHGHHLDPAYNAVILHVTLHDDLGQPVRRRDGRPVTTLALPPFLLGPPADFPAEPRLRPLGSIGFDHCAPRVAATRPDLIHEAWERAGDARLSAKVTTMAHLLSHASPADVLYERILDALGYTRNREGMRAVAGLLPYGYLDARLSGCAPAERQRQAACLLLGVAGFLPLSPREAELAGLDPAQIATIEDSWRRLATPWLGATLPPTTWTLTRQRPAAHPLRRLLALAALLARLRVGLIEDLCALLGSADPYAQIRDWLTVENPWLGTSHAHEIIVNVVVPFALAYGTEAGDDSIVLAASRLWERLPAGRGNHLIRRTVEQICGPAHVPVRTARAEQGVLHLNRTGCSLMRCYECPIARLALEQP